MKKDNMRCGVAVTAPVSEDVRYAAYRVFFGTLTSPQRLQIINALREKSQTVSALEERLGIEQTALSHHLRKLRHCGFVIATQDGRSRVYALNPHTIVPIMDAIDRHMGNHCIRIVQSREKKKRVR